MLLWLFAVALYLASLGMLTAAPAAPEINNVEPFVWQVGATNPITIEGKELANVRGLWTSRHGVLETNLMTAATEDEGKRVKLAVPIDPMMASGPFALRLITDGGISAPVMAMLEAIPELKPDESGLVAGVGYLAGSVTEASGVQFRVRLTRKDLFAMDVCAGRFGSKLDPVLQITREDGTEILFAQDSPRVGVDTIARFEAPQSGDYVVGIRDASYGSGREFKYHIRFGPASGGESVPLVAGTNNFNVIPTSGAGGFGEQNRFLEDYARTLQHNPLAILVASGRNLRLQEPQHSSYWLRPVANYSVGEMLFWPEDPRLHPNLHGVVSLNGSFRRPTDQIGFDLMVKTPVKLRYVAMSRRLGGQCDPLMRIEEADDESSADDTAAPPADGEDRTEPPSAPQETP